jgi:hypothetical protein
MKPWESEILSPLTRQKMEVSGHLKFQAVFPGGKGEEYSKNRRRAGNPVTSPPTFECVLYSVALTMLSMLLYMETKRCLYLNHTK